MTFSNVGLSYVTPGWSPRPARLPQCGTLVIANLGQGCQVSHQFFAYLFGNKCVLDGISAVVFGPWTRGGTVVIGQWAALGPMVDRKRWTRRRITKVTFSNVGLTRETTLRVKVDLESPT